MTDLEKFIAFYRQFNIELEAYVPKWDNNVIAIDLIADEFVGHCYSRIEFTKEGKFIEQGFWDL